MRSEKSFPRGFRAFLLMAAAWGAALQAGAQAAKQRVSDLDDLKFARPELRVFAQHEDLNQARTETSAPVLAAFDTFLRDEGMGWRTVFDFVTGRPALIEGAGIPWIPGTGNGLTPADLGLAKSGKPGPVPLRVVAAKAMSFLLKYPDLLGVDPHDLMLVPEASGPVSDYLYFIDLEWRYHGLPVENAHVVFRINHGNMVQFGQENISDAIASLDPLPSISRETAWEILRGYAGGSDLADKVVEPGRLLVMPVMKPEAASGARVAAGKGLEYRLVYVLSFERQGVLGTWEARVDAHTGEILSFRDVNDYGKVHGGVYPLDRLQPEADRPLPFADVGGGVFADQMGFFAGLNGTSTLGGKYAAINEHCGGISAATTTGDLNFGMSGGTDCATPGSGGAGNTHAARTAFYAINLVKEKARSYLPANAWLNGNLAVETDISPYCNAFSNGAGLHFYKSVGVGNGITCGNSGEFATVVTHEFGHQLDSNDGSGFSPDNGTAEAYADTAFMLQLHSSCIGNGLYTKPNNTIICGGYGNPCTSCSGWRDMDYANHNDPTPSTPAMLNGSTGYNCGSPFPGYPGPCGYEGHCEGVIIGQAMWDLATRDLTAMGLDVDTAWQVVDKLWYFSRSTATAAYACPTLATTNGCGAGSAYSVFRVVDDCDGNLANGTPHAAAIFAAMNRHKMACGLAGDATNQNQGGCCPSFGAPTVTTVLGTNQVTVNWTPVGGAVFYAIYRNEVSCGAGYMLLGAVPAPTVTLTDATAAGGVPYFYRVQAVGLTFACTGPLSACAAAGGPLSATASGVPTTGIAPFTVNFTGAGVNGTPPYSYSWDFGDGSPAGTGPTPSHVYSSPGAFTVKLTVTDSASPAVVATAPAFTVTVCGNMTASPATLPVMTAGTYYSILFTGSGGVGPYIMDLTGTLPAGMTWNLGLNKLTGTPMQLGTFPLSLRIVDANACLSIVPYSLTVVCPVVTLSPSTVPPAILNKKYCQQLTASGCVGACTFTILSGALPPGLAMDPTGYISGIPTAHGAFTFTVRATTILGCHGDQTYTLKDFDLVLVDDLGRSRFYVDTTTGSYQWDITSGPETGTTLSGTGKVFNEGAKVTNLPGDPSGSFSVTYDPVRHKASGWLITAAKHYVALSDADTSNDVPPCP